MQLTKQHIKKIITLWDSQNTSDIAKEIGCSSSRISQIASRIRKMRPGLLTEKKRWGYMNLLLEDVLKDYPKK